jgi:hypothetical protein
MRRRKKPGNHQAKQKRSAGTPSSLALASVRRAKVLVILYNSVAEYRGTHPAIPPACEYAACTARPS